MEMGFATRPATGGTAGALSMGDWPGLRARLVAAHAIRRTLLSDFAGSARIEASFAPAAAQALALCEEDLSRVNRTSLADGKCLSGMNVDLAAQTKPGERGK